MFSQSAIQSFTFGIISAISLPLGAITILLWKPGEKTIAALMAFGGGALLAALTIDLVGNALDHGHFYPLALGCIAGGILFVILDFAVNSKGGFLRKSSTTYDYLKKMKTKEVRELFERLSVIALFQNLPPEQVSRLIPFISRVSYPGGTMIMEQNAPGESLLLIDNGEVDIVDSKRNTIIDVLKAGDVVGEMALVTGEKRSASVIARNDVDGWLLERNDFERVLRDAPVLAKAFHEIVEKRIELLKNANALDESTAAGWRSKASNALDSWITGPTEEEIKKASEEHHGAPLAIWMGILLDGIPESFVIGASTIHASISFSLVAGLFLSNYPEALSSSMGMRRQGTGNAKIVMMWGSLTLITGIGAFFGHLFFQSAPGWLFAGTEGCAAGAMLTMIAQTMLPEAYRKGGWITGLATLSGFLAAIFFKVLE